MTSGCVEVGKGTLYGTENRAVEPLRLMTWDEARSASASGAACLLADWVSSYLMRPHPDLGRSGHVCPFTAQAVRLSLLRIGISSLGADDPAGVRRMMLQAIRAFDAMACPRSSRIFRTVVVGFPQCGTPTGVATLRHVQNAMRHHSTLFGKMIGLFEPESEAEGLINAAFRPQRAPVPVLAIRLLVEQDAPFVRRNPLLLPIYMAKFPVAGTRRLIATLGR